MSERGLTLAEVLGITGHGTPPQAAEGVDPVKEVQALRNVLEALQERSDAPWNVGTILRHKFPKRAMLTIAHKPAMFMGWLEKPIRGLDLVTSPEQLASYSATLEWDCKIMLLHPDAPKAVCYLADSAEWEPDPMFADKAANGAG